RPHGGPATRSRCSASSTRCWSGASVRAGSAPSAYLRDPTRPHLASPTYLTHPPHAPKETAMGSSSWSTDAYHARRAYEDSAGVSSFGYHDDVAAKIPRHEWKAHPTLDPHGVTVRESRDS